MGRAFSDTGGFKPCVDPVHAVIAFNSLFGLGIELRNRPGTGSGTAHAANAFLLIDVDNPIFSFYHGLSWTDWQTERIFAVIT
jgi:hypothetical protein